MKIFNICAVIATTLCFASVAQAAEYLPLYGVTQSPVGYSDYCRRYTPICDTGERQARDVVMTSVYWEVLNRVNQSINASIQPMTDMDHWGVEEQWDYGDDGYGDCEDYVLAKRRELLRQGWARQGLLITVVLDKNGDGHAVLTVRTDWGEFVLDNQRSEILPPSQTGYTFIKRQAQTNPNVWIALRPSRALVGSIR